LDADQYLIDKETNVDIFFISIQPVGEKLEGFHNVSHPLPVHVRDILQAKVALYSSNDLRGILDFKRIGY
jgi:hypothetical protein